MTTTFNDIKFSLRQLAKHPGFALIVVLLLGLGIGVNTAIFSVAHTLIRRSLPVKNPQELVEFVRVFKDHGKATNIPYTVFEELQGHDQVLTGCFAFDQDEVRLRTDEGLVGLTVHGVSDSFFNVLGVSAFQGRTFGVEMDSVGDDSHIVVLSHALWTNRFGADPEILGRSLEIDSQSLRVVGIMPPGFFGVDRSRVPDLWRPLSLHKYLRYAWMLGRLQPGVTPAQAQAQLQPAFQKGLTVFDPKAATDRLEVNKASAGTSGLRWTYWQYSHTLKILIGLAAMVFLTACANLANLLMARSASRLPEIRIRSALGANRYRILRQILVESLLLAVLGGVASLIVAVWGHHLLIISLLGTAEGQVLAFELNVQVLGFACLLAIAAGMFFGLAPAWWMTRPRCQAQQVNTLNMRDVTRIPLARSLVAFQMALTIIGLFSAGLFQHTLRNLKHSDLGFNSHSLVMVDVGIPHGMPPGQQTPFWQRILQHTETLPGVTHASLALDGAFYGGWNKELWIPSLNQNISKIKIRFNCVEPHFFTTLGIPLLEGRGFNAQDSQRSTRAAVVNQAFVRKFYGTTNPIGQHFNDQGPHDAQGICEITGVVPDGKHSHVRERHRPMVYYLLPANHPNRGRVLHVRGQGNPSALTTLLRREIPTLHRDLFISNIYTVTDLVDEQIRNERLFAMMASLFGILILVLGGIGLYGLLSFNVIQRTRDIGIRMALGATPRWVAMPLLRETLWMSLAGLAAGIPLALVLTHVIRSSLYGINPNDPLTLLGTIGTLIVVTLLATWIPARRAVTIEPMEALRYE
ncbi:ABC transporter permease [Planctomycetota bacterium]